MGNRIHPTAVIGPHVQLGDGNIIGPFVVLIGCRMGDDNWVGPHVVIGTPPEIRGHAHPAGWDDVDEGYGVSIGDRTTLREYTTVSAGSQAPTTVGDDCFLMNKVYVGHDGRIGDTVTMAAGAGLGGHVTVGAGANLGLGATVHQRRRIGAGTMVGMGAVVTRDLPPFAMAYGNPARIRGANRVGMQRAGFASSDVELMQETYSRHGGVPDDWAPPPSMAALFSPDPSSSRTI
ncbi:MAG: UDP-N-acetylglucosamine acyltransferase [Actinomycetota bacterium]|nr:UDP-N-acetylglucosamine acyltransferase [Actinomycetota bacterium]